MDEPLSHEAGGTAAATGHVVLCGLGHVGHRCLLLLRRVGCPVTVVTSGDQADWVADAREHGRVVEGDARDDRLLKQAGVETARAVLAVTDDDLTNLSIALDSRRLNPQVRIVVRVFDQDLAGHLERTIGVARVLSASAIAAPAFAAAALGQDVIGSFEEEGSVFLVEECRADANAGQTIAQWMSGREAAVIQHEHDGAVDVLPDADMALAANGRLTVARETSGVSARGGARPVLAARSMAAIWNLWRETPRLLTATLAGLVCIVIISTLVFHRALNMPMIDSLYFVTTIVTTVGFGDYNLMHAHPALKLYGAFLMVCGAAILAVIFSIVTDVLLRTRLRELLLRGGTGRSGHVIVAGLGHIGYRVVRELQACGEEVVAIERDENGAFVSSARSIVPVLVGNAAAGGLLERAGAAGARAILAVTDNDMANLSIGLAAKRINPQARVVLRLFDSGLAEKMRQSAGIDAALSMSAVAAATFTASALCDGVVHAFVSGNRLLVIARHRGPQRPNRGCLFARRGGTNRHAWKAVPPGLQAEQGNEYLELITIPLDGNG